MTHIKITPNHNRNLSNQEQRYQNHSFDDYPF